MRKFALFALLMLCLSLTISGAALAQEATTTPGFCGGLSDADCAILFNAQTAMASVDSASFDVAFNLTVTNIPNMTQPLTVNFTGNGSYSGLQKLYDDMTVAASGDAGAAILSVINDLDADLTFTINLPPELVAQMGPRVPATITFQERLVDGFGYINLDTLRGLMGGSGTARLQGWYGIDLANLMKDLIEKMPDTFSNPLSGSGVTQDDAQMFGSRDFLQRFVKLERTDDGSGNTATFQLTVGMGTLMGSPEFQALMRRQMQRQNPSMTDEQMDEAIAMAAQMFKGMGMTITEEIGIDDGYLHSLSGNFSFDTAGMMAVMQSQGSSAPATTTTTTPSPKINMDFTFTYSNFNTAPEITAPPNATIIPYQSLLGNRVVTA